MNVIIIKACHVHTSTSHSIVAGNLPESPRNWATRVQREHQAPPDHSMLRRQNKQTDAWNPLSALVFFSWILVVQLTGLAAFTKGFFLTRVELGRQSECDVS